MKRLSIKAILYLAGWYAASLGINAQTVTAKSATAATNYAISLPGGADGNLSNVAIPALNITALPVTIEMWYKPDAAQNYYSTLWYNRGASNNSGVQYDRWTDITKIKGVWNGNAGTGLPTAKPVAGQWNHVALVMTATSKTLYINGVAFEQAAASPTTPYANYPFDGITYLGWDKPNETLKDRTLKGLIDEFRVWNTARTAQELETNKYNTLTGLETGLIGYWNFDDQAATATDLTTNGRHATISGGTYVPSTYAEPMVFTSASLSQQSYEIGAPANDVLVAKLALTTNNQIDPLRLTSLLLNTNGTTDLSNISNINVYFTGTDNNFGTTQKIATLGTPPSSSTITLACDQTLKPGANYIWITYNVATTAVKGNLLDVECTSLDLTGSATQTYAPSVSAPAGYLTINPDAFMPNTKLPVAVVTTAAETPLLGANFVSFQQNAIMTYNGYQYVTYWNNAYHVCIARKKLPLGTWQVVEFLDHTVTAARITDGHYSISMGICPNDGTIHISYDQHGDTFRYKYSVVDLANKPDQVAWSAASFYAKRDYLISGQQLTLVTYPRFVAKPNGDLLFEYRYGTSGGGNSILHEYKASTGVWSKIGKYVDGLTTTNNNAYLNGIHYDANGRLHASWVWRETPDPLTNHDVCYVYSDDDGRNWYNHAGTLMGTVDSNPIKSTTSGIIVYPLAQNRGLINQESQAVDSKGGIHILQSFLLDGDANSTNFWNGRDAAYLRHIYKDEAGVWKCDNIGAIARNRSEIAVDEGDNVYVIAPNYRIYYASAAEKWQKWTTFDISESASAINEGLVDRELLLNESVLSFVFAQTGGKVLVPYYLVDKSKQGKGTGLNNSVYGDDTFTNQLSQSLGQLNLTSADITHTGESVSIRSVGTIETELAEAYTLKYTTTGESNVWVNDQLVLSTGALSSQTTFPIALALQPSHKYTLKIEGRYATNNVMTKLEWESNRQPNEIIPLTALYGTLVDIPSKVNAPASLMAKVKCMPNPFSASTIIELVGQFSFELYDTNGTLHQQGQATNQLVIGDTLPRGIYFVRVSQNQSSQTVKLIKM